MDNKMAINTYLSITKSKKQTKQTRTQIESWIQRWLPDGMGMWGNGRRGEGIKKYN